MELLYKFRPIDEYAIDILVNKRLYLADYRKLNDAHEGMMYVKPGGNFNYQGHPLRLAEFGDFEIDSMPAKLCSLSKCFSHNLLWSHYGDSHRGMAIGVELPNLEQNIIVEEVVYQNAVPVSGAPVTRKDILQAFLHKSTDWTYEEEVRIITFEPDKTYLDGITIKEVTFGKRALNEHISMVAELLKGQDIKYFKTSYEPGHYTLNKTEINPQKGNFH
jgi:hypothetical protein